MKHTVNEKIIGKLKDLGISEEEAQSYLILWTEGPRSVVQLSKRLGWGRNVVYRILGELEAKNLVSQDIKQNGSIYEAQHYKNFQLIVDKKEKEFTKARSGLEGLFQDIVYLKSANRVSSKVIHYNGIDGLKQVNWNLVNAKGMYRVYEVSRLSSYLDEEFAENLRVEWLKRKVYTRDLTNDKFIEGHTNISEFTMKYSEYRHVDPSVLKIETEVYIYNDIITVLEYDSLKFDPASIFCVEIQNEALAKMQIQIYDVLWTHAKLLKIVDKQGRREL